MIHAGSDGTVIFKGEPDQIVKDYCNILEEIAKCGYRALVVDELKKRMKLQFNRLYGLSIDESE